MKEEGEEEKEEEEKKKRSKRRVMIAIPIREGITLLSLFLERDELWDSLGTLRINSSSHIDDGRA